MIREADEKGIAAAVEELRAGGCIGLPTETVYGLAADGLEAGAVARIFEIKGRPHFDPLILHVAEPEEVERVAAAVPETGRRLMERFWPGPLTLVLPRRALVPDLVTAGLETVAVRCPAHTVARRVLRAFGGPLAAPSANRFGRLSPTTARAVVEELGGAVALVLEGGPCERGIESAIVDCSGERPALLRHGALAREELEAVAGPLELAVAGEKLKAPGLLAHHYAPRLPLWLADEAGGGWGAETAVLAWCRPPEGGGPVRVLSPRRDLREAATRLFASLRELDASGARRIVAEPVPGDGLGAAIRDRLLKASSGRLVREGEHWLEVRRTEECDQGW
jgi:L-threonylcarbamoyladenylate synthase